MAAFSLMSDSVATVDRRSLMRLRMPGHFGLYNMLTPLKRRGVNKLLWRTLQFKAMVVRTGSGISQSPDRK